jgi:hypothetical protein
MRSRHWVVMVALVLALGTMGSVAFADVNNGSFQTGDFTGWTVTGNTGFTLVATNGFNGFNSEDGGDTFFAALGAIDTNAVLTQTFPDVNGQSYVFSFWFNSDGGAPNDFSAYWDGGAPLVSITNSPNPGDWVNYTFTETGTGSDTIEFDAFNTPGYNALDNVSVSGLSPIPEPSSFLLMGSGLIGLAGAIRRKFRK